MNEMPTWIVPVLTLLFAGGGIWTFWKTRADAIGAADESARKLRVELAQLDDELSSERMHRHALEESFNALEIQFNQLGVTLQEQTEELRATRDELAETREELRQQRRRRTELEEQLKNAQHRIDRFEVWIVTQGHNPEEIIKAVTSR